MTKLQMRRRAILAAAPALVAAPYVAQAQTGKPEKTKVVLAVGGKSALYYLSLTIAETKGFFKDAGLDVEINDFQGGAKSLEALMGGSADVVAGAYEHTIRMQQRGQPIKGFALIGRGMQLAIGLRNDVAEKVKGPADIKGMKFGVTAPGSSTQMLVTNWAAKGGLKATDIVAIGVGAGASVVAAIENKSDRRHLTDRSGAHHPAGQEPDQDRGRYAHDEGQPGAVRRHLSGGLPLWPARISHQDSEYRAGAGERHRARQRVAADRVAGGCRERCAGGLPAGRQDGLREIVR